MISREYKQEDIPQISELYYQTVRNVNCKDYSNEHIEAWAPEVYDESFWLRRFDNYDVHVVEKDGMILGFSEYQFPGHIDCFYVHHEWQRKGVGSLLYSAIEKQARDEGTKRLFVDASMTAKSFFLDCGFISVKEQNRIYQKLQFQQYFMEKWLA